jgi:hypothetical protein
MNKTYSNQILYKLELKGQHLHKDLILSYFCFLLVRLIFFSLYFIKHTNYIMKNKQKFFSV